MAGIYGVLLKQSTQKEIYKTFYNADFPNTLQEEISYKNFVFGRSVLNKFKTDRFLFENDQYIVCFEGINYSFLQHPEEIIDAFEKRGTDFVADLKGSFSGFIFSKEGEELLIFNDILSTRVIYYYYDPEHGFAFSSEMHVLSKLLRASGISLNYDFNGIYAVAIYGQCFYNFTTVNEIKKLNYGSSLKFSNLNNKLKEHTYFDFIQRPEERPLDDFLEDIDHLMLAAVKTEWQKDLKNNYQHFALISGGMDSRVNTLLAKELGFDNINTYTYGDPTSSDVKIAQQIAKDNFKTHTQFNLFNGKFFCEQVLENYIKATDGLTYFSANAMIYTAFKAINFTDYGLIHSGQLGDSATGSFIKPNFDYAKNLDKIGVTGFVSDKNLLEKLPFLENIVQDYQNSDNEIFAFEQRQVNGTLMGDKVFNNFIDIASPFYDREFLELILKIPTRFKNNQQIYFDWLNAKHPHITNYKWDKIALKPNNRFNIKYGGLFKKYFNGGKKYLGFPYDSMSPINIWLKKDPSIIKEFDKLFDENIDLIQDKEIQKDFMQIYKDDIFEFRNKFSVLSALLGIKMHFYDS
ncbi:MAG TPA: asparagine synthase-related protein [Flavobacteriaceae bacterium]|nr:asparagine synthase-related protein [Flavobacteriaceae bacterium]